jgi:outer membrane lipoprotein-sorting protein
MTRRIIGAAAVLAACAAAATGGVIDAVREKYDPKASIEADVQVTIYWKVREKEDRKEGHIVLGGGDRFRVQLDKILWVCDGQTVWQYNEKTQQVVIKRLLDVDLSSHPSQIFSTYLKEYSYRENLDDEREAVLNWEADSSDNDPFYRSVALWINTKHVVVTRIVVVDKNGNESTYRFKKTAFGIQPPADLFTFTVPKGVHVLDVRE